MHIQVYSDLHLEQFNTLPEHLTNPDNIKAPYLFLLGDICPVTYHLWLKYIDWCNSQECIKRIFYVIGNHESYNSDYTSTITYIKDTFATKPKYTLLDTDSVYMLEDYIILGCTLWTEIDLATALLMNDYRNIYTDSTHTERIKKEHTVEWHKTHTKWLKKMLVKYSVEKVQKILIATHHMPSFKLIQPKYLLPPESKYNKGFASNLDHLLPYATTWLFGHTHCHIDTFIGNTRCYANPVGYHGEKDVNHNSCEIINLE